MLVLFDGVPPRRRCGRALRRGHGGPVTTRFLLFLNERPPAKDSALGPRSTADVLFIKCAREPRLPRPKGRPPPPPPEGPGIVPLGPDLFPHLFPRRGAPETAGVVSPL